MSSELDGTTGSSTADQGTGEPTLDTAAGADAGTTATDATAKVESFIDPATLPAELKPHWSSMHRAYTKRLEALRGREADLDFLDAYRKSPDVARQVLAQEAARLGLALTPLTADGATTTTQKPGASTAGATGDVPREFIEAMAARLPAELRWMAPAVAPAFWAANQAALAPIVQRTRDQEVSARTRELEELEAELTQMAPGWEAHEADMKALLKFLAGPELRDRRWGSKYALLHRLVTGDATATTEAIRRMGQAAQSRTTTGTPGRTTTSNLADQIRGAKNDREAWDIAARAAVDQLKAQGVTV